MIEPAKRAGMIGSLFALVGILLFAPLALGAPSSSSHPPGLSGNGRAVVGAAALSGALAWKNITQGLHPSARTGASMVYDAADHYVVLFGGDDSAYGDHSLNDTWRFSGGKWMNITSGITPRDRESATIAYDAADGYVVLFGGYSATTNNNHSSRQWVFLNDTWRFVGGKWSNITPGTSPAVSSENVMAFDGKDGYIVLWQDRWVLQHTWVNYPATWTFVSGVWTNQSAASKGPVGYPGTMAYDPHGHFVLLFSEGWGQSTWTFQNLTWTEIQNGGSNPHGSPSARVYPMMAYDAQNKSVILFGGTSAGVNNSVCVLGDTWSFHGGKWAHLTPTVSPPPLYNGAMTYDPGARGVLLFGGTGATACAGPALGDSWILR
jgi:hypothetical protein